MKTRAIKQLLDAMEQGGYQHLDLQIGDERIKLVRSTEALSASAASAPDHQTTDEKVPGGLTTGNSVTIFSDRVGIYSGGKTPVQVGAQVKKGQSLGVIKGISIQDNVGCPVSGTIRQMYVKEGEIVEFGRRLFEIEPA